MGFIQIFNRKTGLVAALVFLSVLAFSCTGVDDPALSMEEIERIAAETLQALPVEEVDFRTSTPLPRTTSATPLILLPTSTALPIPTPGFSSGTRIKFAPGATFGTVRGTINPGQSQIFVLGALLGQPMQTSVSSQNNDVTMSIVTEDGVELLPAEQGLSTWQGSLPDTQGYFFHIFSGEGTEEFTLWVSIPSRIEFESGATSATIKGKTIDGYNATYVAAASGGQTMDILLSPDPNVAALTIWGFSDGQPFMRAIMGSTTFNMKLPSTQDYIISVVPRGGQEVEFTIRVEIK